MLNAGPNQDFSHLIGRSERGKWSKGKNQKLHLRSGLGEPQEMAGKILKKEK